MQSHSSISEKEIISFNLNYYKNDCSSNKEGIQVRASVEIVGIKVEQEGMYRDSLTSSFKE